ncbi:UPF0046 protein T07D4.2 [Diplonema papillatum]|nr:UPF0046 protein T07D4.2 [Diplonema papillatum]KAJ9449217.1 UPF0046 protein T07D4.2 [Diplonema papillatum]
MTSSLSGDFVSSASRCFEFVDRTKSKAAWKYLKEQGIPELSVGNLKPEDLLLPEEPRKLSVVCISDTHNEQRHIPSVPLADVLIHAGDFTDNGNPEDIQKFNTWLGTQPHKHKFVIAGNHELTMCQAKYERMVVAGQVSRSTPRECKRLITNAQYLENEGATVEGVKIWGSPWSPWCSSQWGFGARRGEPMDAIWREIPADTDILVTHGPPIGHGDLCVDNDRAGCVDLLRHVTTRVKPKYHLFGHIHEGYGITTNGTTRFVNCSTCNLRYEPKNPPIVFEVAIPQA